MKNPAKKLSALSLLSSYLLLGLLVGMSYDLNALGVARRSARRYDRRGDRDDMMMDQNS